MMSSAFEVYDPSVYLEPYGAKTNKNFLIWWFFLFFFVPGFLIQAGSKGTYTFFSLFSSGMKQYYQEFEGSSLSGLKVLLSGIFLTLGGANMVGLFPFTYSVSSHFLWTVSLGFPVWVLYLIKSYRENPVSSLSFFLPSFCTVEKNPKYLLMLVLGLLEVVSLFIQPLTLSIRLMANVGAGHLALSLASSMLSVGLPLMSNLLVFLTVAFYFCFELAVNLIQAYIFFLLLLSYSPSNMELKVEA